MTKQAAAKQAAKPSKTPEVERIIATFSLRQPTIPIVYARRWRTAALHSEGGRWAGP